MERFQRFDQIWESISTSLAGIGLLYGVLFALALWFFGHPIIWGVPMGIYVGIVMGVGRHLDQTLTGQRARRWGWVIFVVVAQAGALVLGRLVDRPRLDLADLGMVLVVCVAFLPYSLSEAGGDRLASFRPRSRQRDQ